MTKAKIAILHSGMEGGGFGVCLWIIEALKKDYEVSLITYGKPIDIDRLNEFYGTSFSQAEFRVILLTLPTLLAEVPVICKLRSIIFAFALRWARHNAHCFDLMIGTDDECDFGKPSLQYIHFPSRSTSFLSKSYGIRHPMLRKFIHLIFCLISGFTREGTKRNLTLVNSNWVAKLVKDDYGFDPLVVNPPIKIAQNPRPWEERESGFLLIGRIEQEKRVLSVIEIIKRLRQDGYDVHLHIVGRGNGKYLKKVLDSSKNVSKQFGSPLFLEWGISREKLSRLMCSHKYGIHGHKFEHFGMAPAEMVSGGCIVFLPNGGGQVEIVNKRPEILYKDVEDGVKKIKRVLDDEKLQHDLREDLISGVERFSATRFEHQIKEIVKGFINKGYHPCLQ